MEKLKTAESVTRYLRGKDTSPEQACEVVKALASGKLPVYLPNHAYFVFELLCDRLNDFSGKNFKNWKLHSGVWSLYKQLWTELGEKLLDKEVRAKSFRGVKLVPIMTDVLAHASKTYNETILEEMFSCVELIMATGYVDVDEFAAVGMLKSYAELIYTVSEQNTDFDLVNHWSGIVSALMALPRQASTYKPTKKSTARFFVEPLPVILNTLAQNTNEQLKPTYETLRTIIDDHVFSTDTLQQLPTHIESLVSSSVLTPEGAEYLFQEVILHLALKDIAMCESVYVKIMEKFDSLADKLLGVLSRVNRTLSSTFLSQLYETEMGKPKQNWTLIGYLVSLDADLALAKWQDVVSATKSLQLEKGVKLADDLAVGYVKARDFSKFIKEVYVEGHKTSSRIWTSEDLIQLLAPKVNELSGNQISQLIKHFMEVQDQQSLALVLNGLLLCPLAKQKVSESLFHDYNICQSKWSDIAYLVLSIYGNTLFDSQPEILEKFTSSKNNGKFDIYLRLRVAELTGKTDLVNVEETKKYIKQLSSKDLITFVQRWLVIIDGFPEIHSVLFARMLQQLSGEQVIAVFNDQSDIIYELPGFIKEFQKSLKSNPVKYRDDLFCCFPPIIFRKHFSSYQNQIIEDAIKHPQNLTLRRTICHILQAPSLSSNMEKDLKILRLFLETITTETSQVSMETASLIWNAHLNSIKSETSAKYVNDAFKLLSKNLKKPSSGDLALAQVILSNTNIASHKNLKESKEQLSCQFVAAVRNLKMTVEEQIKALADLPLGVSEEVRVAIRKLIKEVGSQVSGNETKSQLFSLVVKCALPSLSSALFITSSFVAVSETAEDTHVQFMLSQLSEYYRTLPDEVFVNIYKHVLHGVENESGAFASQFVDILSVLAPLLSKDHQKEHTELLVTTIMAVPLRDFQSHPQSLLRFTNTITRLLSDHVWAFTQFSIEATLGLADKIVCSLAKTESAEKIYISTVQMVSYIVLFHRYRLSSRYHLITALASRLMAPLAAENILGTSKLAAASYARFLTALAEPTGHSSAKENDSLTSQAATYKRLLRKHAHVIVVNYVHSQLTAPLTSEMTDTVLRGVYSMIGLLSRIELHLVNQCLDSLGKAYFKTLYTAYRDHGKWRDQ